MQRRSLLLAPLGAAVIGGAGFWMLLKGMQQGNYDPQSLPSALIGKPLPTFSLPGLPPGAGFSARDVVTAGRPALINFFASWCLPCMQEAPVLMSLRQQGTQIWGIAYKDKAVATAEFLKVNGDPYCRVARDDPGDMAGDFGLYGVPETFLVDKSGIVRWHWAGGLSGHVVSHYLTPAMQGLV